MTVDDRLAGALIAAARAFIEELEGVAAEPTAPPPGPVQGVDTAGRSPEPIHYDPLVDEPPIQPKVHGTRAEMDMCSLTYLGAIARINADKRRGADRHEVSEYARKAGYPDGRAVNGWNSNKRGRHQIENVDGLRILNEVGHAMLMELQDRLNVVISGDITPLPTP